MSENVSNPSLQGEWRVQRTGGLLPPLLGVRKRIHGTRGETRLGPLPGIPFEVRGLSLQYRRPFSGLVDELEPEDHGFRGTTQFRGTTIGTFLLRR